MVESTGVVHLVDAAQVLDQAGGEGDVPGGDAKLGFQQVEQAVGAGGDFAQGVFDGLGQGTEMGSGLEL